MRKVLFIKSACLRMILTVTGILALFCAEPWNPMLRAASSITYVLYELEAKGHYDISSSDAIIDGAAIGTMSISNATVVQPGSIPTYDVKGDKSKITYSFSKTRISSGKDDWIIVDDKSKEVNGEKLDQNILSGAVIVQTSVDGNKWVTDKSMTNIFSGNNTTIELYEPNEVQMSNGCFFRILVVYKERAKVRNSSIFGLDTSSYAYRKRAEVYEFHMTNNSMERAGTQSPEEGLNRHEYHEFHEVNKKRGEAYALARTTDMDKNDPHLSWELGYFVINGFSQEVQYNGQDVYLKTPGDKVTLWFKLMEDIDKLNNKDNLSISNDTSRVDSDFNVESNSFRHGALIVRHTNSQGTPKVNVYTDFLLASTKTGANTKLVINEEGTYEVALDYEIKDSKGIGSYKSYKLVCRFSVRNGSSMFYPFDAKTNSELADNSYTKNGFRIDLAKSESLNIKVYRYEIQETPSGIRADQRMNGAKAESVVYSDEGIYVLTVSNKYADDSTTKTIYVGDSSLIEKLWFNHIGVSDIKELNEKLSDGWYFDEETLKLQRKQIVIPEIQPAPTAIEAPPEPPSELTVIPKPEEQTQPSAPPVNSTPTVIDTPEPEVLPVPPASEPAATQSALPIILWSSLAVVGGGGALMFAHRKKATRRIGSSEKPIEVADFSVRDSEDGDEE